MQIEIVPAGERLVSIAAAALYGGVFICLFFFFTFFAAVIKHNLGAHRTSVWEYMTYACVYIYIYK